MAQLIDGKALADNLTSQLKDELLQLKLPRQPGLATVLIGDNRASQIYVRNKRKRALEIGIASFHHEISSNNADEETVVRLIDHLNNDPRIDGILIQLPLPHHLNEQRILLSLDPHKDVDGIHPLNLGFLFRGDPRIAPCTPLGIMHMLAAINYDVIGKHAVIIGRSTIVGKPMAHLFLQDNATVTICHSQTKDLPSITKAADILVVAVGRAHMINSSHIKPQAVVIDVGINRDANNKLVGDVDFKSASSIASYITPVPAGVGPMTIAMLLKNCVQQFKAGQHHGRAKNTAL